MSVARTESAGADGSKSAGVRGGSRIPRRRGPALAVRAGKGENQGLRGRSARPFPIVPTATFSLKPILLEYGADEPLVLEPALHAELLEARGPSGCDGERARGLASDALGSPRRVPALGAHVVPGDRVAIALAGAVPHGGEVVAAIRERLARAGVEASDTAILRSPPIAGLQGVGTGPRLEGEVSFDPLRESETAYIAADVDGRPLHVARVLVDADVVVAVGTRTWDAALGGASLDGDLWPAFARASGRADVVRSLARSGRKAREPLAARAREIGWQLGAMASVRVVPGRRDSLHAVVFDTPWGAARGALRQAGDWRPHVRGDADLVVASLAEPAGGITPVIRAVAAAARAAHPAGTICLACRLAEPPGPVVQRWRQGVALEPLVMEALRSGDPALVADAFAARFLARALGDRRLVLLCDLPAESVEDLGFGHAAGPEAVERLAHRAERIAVLHEADRMFPRVG